MFLKLTLFSVLLILDSGTISLAQSADQAEYWKVTITSTSLDDVSQRLSNPSAPRWPAILSPYAVQQLPPLQKPFNTECLTLAQAMQEKLAASFDKDAEPTQKNLEIEIAIYNSIADALVRSGGYTNQVLADNAVRLAIYRISGWIILHPQDALEGRKLMSLLKVSPVVTSNLLSEMVDQDPEVQKNRNSISNVKQGDNVFVGFKSMGEGTLSFLNSSQQRTSKLLNNPSVYALIMRMATTESLIKVNLEGTIHFFEAGGLYSELNPKDIRAFEARMANTSKDYSYSLLQIKRFTENHVMYLVDIHKNPSVKSAFLDIVLN